MVHTLLWSGVILLLISNIISLVYIYIQYKSRIECSKLMDIRDQEIGYLELALIDLNKDNDNLNKINTKLNESNKELKSKLDKINIQVRQIREHFKSN